MGKDGIKIWIIAYPNIEPEILSPEWNKFRVPIVGEIVYYKNQSYIVQKVYFNIDEKVIKILVM